MTVINEKIFNKIYKFITLVAMSCVITPFSYMIFFRALNINGIISFITSMLLLMLGYLLQSIYGKIVNINLKSQDLSYESNTKFFNIKNAALPITICVIVSIVLFNIIIGYLKYRTEVGIDLVYDQYSLHPYVMMLMALTIMIIGVVMWFYPYNRIISVRSMFVYFCLFVIAFIFPWSSQWIATLSFILFMICALVILNQSYIIKAINLTKIGVVTTRVRLYNIGIVALFFVAVICVLIVVASILVGLSVVFKFLLFLILGTIFRDDGFVDETTIGDEIGAAVFDMSLMNMSGNNITIHALWYLFILLIIGFILSLIFIKKIRVIFKSIGDFFGYLINNIISLFTDVFSFFTKNDKVESDEYINYKDEEIDIDKISAKIKMREFSNKKYTYKDYSNDFNTLKTFDEKYKFAYQTLVKCWNDMNFSLRTSDTPRQIKEKLLARTTIDDLNDITQTFEIYQYSDFNMEINIGTLTQLDQMNKLIAKYYD